MSLFEEARTFQRKIERSAKSQTASRLEDTNELRAILREGVFEFEELLKALPTDQREAAYVLYLHHIRRVTCAMHVAVDSLVNKNRLGNQLPDEKMFADHPNVVPSGQHIAQLYRY